MKIKYHEALHKATSVLTAPICKHGTTHNNVYREQSSERETLTLEVSRLQEMHPTFTLYLHQSTEQCDVLSQPRKGKG